MVCIPEGIFFVCIHRVCLYMWMFWLLLLLKLWLAFIVSTDIWLIWYYFEASIEFIYNIIYQSLDEIGFVRAKRAIISFRISQNISSYKKHVSPPSLRKTPQIIFLSSQLIFSRTSHPPNQLETDTRIFQQTRNVCGDEKAVKNLTTNFWCKRQKESHLQIRKVHIYIDWFRVKRERLNWLKSNICNEGSEVHGEEMKMYILYCHPHEKILLLTFW